MTAAALLLLCAAATAAAGGAAVLDPRPIKLAVPTVAHLAFHEDNLGAISHFGMQTFLEKGDRKCSLGREPVDTFDPDRLDTDQWVQTAASFGAKYYVLVADHFSGFTLYDSKVTNYSVAYAKWRQGKGDIVADFVASCKKYKVHPAVYYSVHENWGEHVCNFNLSDAPNGPKQTAFEDLSMAQLAEITEKYGDDLAGVWFDGGVRQAPPFVQRMNDFVHTKLPGKAWCHSCTMGNVAASMNDVSAVSWMGNEGTVMPYPLYNANDQAGTHTGQRSLGQSASFGVANGTRWMPAHCDAVLRRHFWFWSTTYNQSANLNTPQDLLGMHLTSVGRGCNMVLDMSPTPTGLLQANDVATYAAFGDGQTKLYTDALAASINGTQGQSSYVLAVGKGASFKAVGRGAIELREELSAGQAICNYTVEYSSSASGGGWKPLPLRNERQLTIGNRRIQFWADVAGGVAAVRVKLATLEMRSGQLAEPRLRSLKLFDWSDPALDSLLTSILKIE